MPKIEAVDQAGEHKQFTVNPNLTPGDVTRMIGFPANVKDDPDKVKRSWGFTVDGERCGVWDYKGSRWSAWGPLEALQKVFGAENVR